MGRFKFFFAGSILFATVFQGCLLGGEDEEMPREEQVLSLSGVWESMGRKFLFTSQTCTVFYNPYRETCTSQDEYVPVIMTWNFVEDGTYSFTSHDDTSLVYEEHGQWAQSGRNLNLVLGDCRLAEYSLFANTWSQPKNKVCSGETESYSLRFGDKAFYIVEPDTVTGRLDTTATYVRKPR